MFHKEINFPISKLVGGGKVSRVKTNVVWILKMLSVI
jgi:hypothetical protein